MTITHDKLNPLDAAMRDELLDRGVAATDALHDLVPIILRAASEVAEVVLEMSAVSHGLTDDEFDQVLDLSVWGEMTGLAYFLSQILRDGPEPPLGAGLPAERFAADWRRYVIEYAL